MLREHRLALDCNRLDELGVLSSSELLDCSSGSLVLVVGPAVVRQALPTAKGHHFISLEDEDGFVNIDVRPNVYSRYRTTLRTLPLLIVNSEVQRQGAVINLV